MTGGSLGLRTGSYGSLQQHLQNGVLLPIQTTPVTIRRPAKMVVSGLREKDKFLPWIFKVAGRRKVGMLLLVIISAAVFLSHLTATNKEGPETNLSPHHTFRNPGRIDLQFKPSRIPESDSNKVNEHPIPERQSETFVIESQPHISSIHANRFSSRHPCESFSLPPPPADSKRTGPRLCPVCYIPVEHAMALMPNSPSMSLVLKNLAYVSEDNSVENESNGGSAFGGHPSLQQRSDSFDIKESMTVHCGFVKGNKPGNGTGFDIDNVDLLEMEQCRGVVVASAIFGNYDIIQQPKNISEAAKRSACFYMFVDEETEAYIKNSSTLDSTKRVGLWRVVVVRNLPYVDARRNGKVPKLLLHRLFPNTRFSLWIDGKLELVVDPYQILERFLWRKNATFAISRHYRRFDVYEEAEANKIAGKYDNASIDYQIGFYRKEGLTHYSEAKLPITSDVPEGCVIIKEHTPITNLFTCLWFNEVDRFTSRDQLSFSTVRDRVMSKVDWSIEMFLDCERRNFVVQAYHRDILEHMMSLADSLSHQPPPVSDNDSHRKQSTDSVADKVARTIVKKPQVRHGRDRRSSWRGWKRHRPRAGSGRDTNSI